MLKEVESMRQYQENIENLNEIAHNRPRAHLVLGEAIFSFLCIVSVTYPFIHSFTDNNVLICYDLRKNILEENFHLNLQAAYWLIIVEIKDLFFLTPIFFNILHLRFL